MSEIQIIKVNEVRMRILAEDYIREELNDYFKFEDPNFQPNPFSKWDGVVRLFTKSSGLIDIGLLFEVFKFCKMNGYTIKLDPALKYIQDIPDEEIHTFINSLNAVYRDENKQYQIATVRDYQFDSVATAIRQSRCVLEAATSAGKSFILYIMARYYRQRREALESNLKTLIVVPSIHLVTQLYDNFEEYSHGTDWNPMMNVQMICEGATKDIFKPIVISTWQGIQNQPKEWFHQFGDIVVDEVHTSKSDKLSYILNNCINADQRLGVTGTLANTKVAGLQVVAHFGAYHKIITARDLINLGYATDIHVNMIEVIHPMADCIEMHGAEYQKEIEFLIANERRNELIARMALSLKGNVAVMFERIDAHMMIVYEMLSAVKKNVFVINGEVKTEVRKQIQAAMEEGEDITLLASYGTMQQGVSIKKLHHLILAHPSKSYIRVIQTLGRLMRQHSSKDVAKIWDLVDNLRYKGFSYNHALRHSHERYKFYLMERHPVQMKKVSLQ
ncbi:putative RNA-DNA and DNA-DNA helicase [Salmonella phage GEC_vB_N6]|nr:putative DNA-RNA and DNA-DNA helicase [Salmonella phage GEC_vB_GOT]QPI15346.1 putative RNA-DNA and DNA-DNA helicase [Salmonella phage GEC_vB_N6]